MTLFYNFRFIKFFQSLKPFEANEFFSRATWLCFRLKEALDCVTKPKRFEDHGYFNKNLLFDLNKN